MVLIILVYIYIIQYTCKEYQSCDYLERLPEKYKQRKCSLNQIQNIC